MTLELLVLGVVGIGLPATLLVFCWRLLQAAEASDDER